MLQLPSLWVIHETLQPELAGGLTMIVEGLSLALKQQVRVQTDRILSPEFLIIDLNPSQLRPMSSFPYGGSSSPSSQPVIS
jgi:hypothetical protein